MPAASSFPLFLEDSLMNDIIVSFSVVTGVTVNMYCDMNNRIMTVVRRC